MVLKFSRKCKIDHIDQREKMFLFQHFFFRFHYLHVQFFDLFPPPLISICRGKIDHAAQREKMFLFQHFLFRFHHLHF